MKRSIRIAGGVTALVLLLAGAYFVGGGLLGQEDPPGDGREIMASSSGGEGVGKMEIIDDFTTADELPNAPLDGLGSFVRRDDNSIFIRQFETGDDGPETEVVVTHDTQIYQDVTFNQFTDGIPSGQIQQVLQVVTLDEIGPGSIIRVWGEKRGDRLIAEVIMFSVPVMMQH